MFWTTLLLTGLAQASPTPPPTYAVLESDRIVVVERGERRSVPHSEDAETFAWDHGGEGLLVTRGAALERIDARGGEVRRLFDGAAHGFVELRMPDVSPDGARIVCAARADGPQEWKVVQLDRGGEPQVLCDGYDPCFTREGDAVLCERYPDRDVWRFELASGELRRAFEPQADRYTVQADPYRARTAFSSKGRLVLRDDIAGAEGSFSPDGAYDRFASFAPDRRSLLFFRQLTKPDGGEFRGVVERDLVSGHERIVADGSAQLAFYAPPSLAAFAQLSKQARETLELDARLGVSSERDPWLRRWLEREAREAPEQHLYLSELTELAPCEAAVLREFRGDALFLPRVRSLDAATAQLLAEFRGSLFLDGVARLDVPTARALATWKGNGEQLFLSLDGLRHPSAEVLEALGECRGWGLSLEGIVALTPPTARALGPIHVATLDLDGVAALDRATAEALSRWNAKFLSLRGWRDPEPALVELVRKGCAELELD